MKYLTTYKFFESIVFDKDSIFEPSIPSEYQNILSDILLPFSDKYVVNVFYHNNGKDAGLPQNNKIKTFKNCIYIRLNGVKYSEIQDDFEFVVNYLEKEMNIEYQLLVNVFEIEKIISYFFDIDKGVNNSQSINYIKIFINI